MSNLPNVSRSRRKFDLSHRVATSLKVGKLTPIDIVEVLPGDTWDVTPKSLCRLAVPLVRPIMDSIYLDTYSFFVPLRICQDNLEGVFGSSAPTSYEAQSLANIASASFDVGEIPVPGSVLDYLGLPTSLVGTSSENPQLTGYYSLLPVRAFALIWNEFFRVETVDPEVFVYRGDDQGVDEVMNSSSWSASNYFGMLPP